MPDNYNTPKSFIPKVDKAKTNAGKCYKCKEKIQKAEVRISFKASYYHVKCIKELNVILGSSDKYFFINIFSYFFYFSISGYELLESNEKSLLDNYFPKEMYDLLYIFIT